ncbi:MAG: FtsX-like permease family protein [Myxococcales bacterium]|nr:FtsX-like permease family protein [Myxococcales bacterium]
MIEGLRRVVRGIREHFYFFVVSTGVVASALVLLGLFAMVLRDVNAMVGSWQADQHVSAYFAAGVTPEVETEMHALVAGRREVAKVERVTSADAAVWMTERAPELAAVFSELGPAALPASLEITLQPEIATPEKMEAFVASLKIQGTRPDGDGVIGTVWEDVDYGQEWVARVHTFLSLLTALGFAFGAATGLATLFLVANTIHLVVHARQDELAILRLVGATERYIVGPFIVEGVMQGLIGGLTATVVLYAIHQGLLVRLHSLLSLAMGAAPTFLPADQVVVLVATGVALGAGAAWGAVRRFLARLP